jgi:hypothetical protein
MKNELISKLEAYINGAIGREEFSSWFYAFSRRAEKRFTGSLLEFVYEVEGVLAEASSGSWSEEGLIEELEMLLDKYKPVNEVLTITVGLSGQATAPSQAHLNFAFPRV